MKTTRMLADFEGVVIGGELRIEGIDSFMLILVREHYWGRIYKCFPDDVELLPLPKE